MGLTLLLGLGVPATALAGTEAKVTAHEYQLYMDWKDGRDDPRLKNASEATKLKKIARSLHVSAAELKAAVAKVKPVAGLLGQQTQSSIRAALQTTMLKGRLREVHVDAGQGHVVAGVKWDCGDSRDWDKEAAYAAWGVTDAGHIVKTLVVWCVDAADTKLFSAKIGRTAFAKISKRSIERFATTRYIRLFEEVRRGPHR